MEERPYSVTRNIRYEHRLISFNDLEDFLPWSAQHLAEEGFFYLSRTRTIKCCFCGFEMSDWSSGILPSHCQNRNYSILLEHHTGNLMVPSGRSIDNDTTPQTPELTHLREHVQTPLGETQQRHTGVNHTWSSDTAHSNRPCFSTLVRLNTLKSGQERLETPTQTLENFSVEIEGCARPENPALSVVAARQIPRDQGARRRSPTPKSVKPLMPRDSDSSLTSSSTVGLSQSNTTHPQSEAGTPDSPSTIQLSRRVRKSTAVPQMYRHRLATFEGLSVPLSYPPDILAAGGFYYEVDSRRVKCFSCGGILQMSTTNPRSIEAGHTTDCKHASTVQQISEPSSEPVSLTDSEIASLPMVQEVADLSFKVPDIVNACRELNSTLDIRNITRLQVLSYFYEEEEGEFLHDNPEPCECCICCQELLSLLFLPCRHGCCRSCKQTLVLDHCPKCDAVVKATTNVYIP